MKPEKENNKLIAEFMGYSEFPVDENIYWCKSLGEGRISDLKTLDDLGFDTNWDALHSVLDKINRTDYLLPDGFPCDRWIRIHKLSFFDSIDTVHRYVVEYIRWYKFEKK